jgi:hypothetical protein
MNDPALPVKEGTVGECLDTCECFVTAPVQVWSLPTA